MTWICSQCGEKFSRFRTRCSSDGQRVIEDLAGQLIGGRYRIRELVGIGGMDSTVWKAWQTGTERVVAVKVLPAAEEAAAKRFARGARIAANLNHPNCTVVHDYGRSDDGKLFLVMEYLTGQVLQEVLGPEGMSAGDTVHVADQVLQALEHAHGQRAVHRDLKPDNLFLSRKNDDPLHVKILDFGIAKYVEEDPENPASAEDGPSDGFEDLVTEQRQVCGTPQYMAPEQVVGARIDGRTDLYSLGVVMYRMLTGRLPFDGKTRYELYQKHLQEAPKPFHDLRPDLVFPERLELIVLKALSKRPDQRFQNAAEMRKALATIEVHDERQRRGVRPRVSLKHTSPQEHGTGAAGVIVSSAEQTLLPASPTVLPGGMWTLSQPSPVLDSAATGRAVGAPGNAPPPLPAAVARAYANDGRDPGAMPLSRTSQPVVVPVSAGGARPSPSIPTDFASPAVLAPRTTGPVPDVRGARVGTGAPSFTVEDTRIPTPPEAVRLAPQSPARLPTPSLTGKATSTNLLSDAVMRHPAGRSSLAVAPEVPRSTETEPNRAREAGEKRRRRLSIVAVLAAAFLVGVGGVALTMQLVGQDGDGVEPAPVEATQATRPATVASDRVEPAGIEGSLPGTKQPIGAGREATEKLNEVAVEATLSKTVETTTAGTLAGHALAEVPVEPAAVKVAVKIDSVPAGAMVSEGLTQIGPTPLEMSVLSGRHVYTLAREGFVNAVVEIDAVKTNSASPIERKLVLVATRPAPPEAPPHNYIRPRAPPTDPNKLLKNLTPTEKPPTEKPPIEKPAVEKIEKPDPPGKPQVKLLDDKPTTTTDPGKKPTIKLLGDDEESSPKKPQVKLLD